MGLATAWRAAAAGLRVVLIEQFEFGHVRGASHGTERIFRYGYTDRTYVRLAVAAEDGWRQLEADSGVALKGRFALTVGHNALQVFDMAPYYNSRAVISKLKPAKKYRLNPGQAGIYQDGKIHSIDYPDSSRFVRVTGTNLDRIPRIRIDLKTGEVHQMTPQQAT